MKYSIKKKDQSSLSITMKFEEADLNKHKETALKDITKDVNVKGFRKGKAPKDKVIAEVGEGYILQKAVDVALQEGMFEVVTKEKCKVIGQPQVDIKTVDPLELVVDVDVMPELKAVDVKKIKIKSQEIKISKKDIEEAISNITSQNMQWNVVERKAKKGDRVEIDFDGFIDDKPFPGGASKHHPLELGSNTFIPGFEDQLIGSKAEDSLDVNVTFPKDYGKAEFQGKKALFKVKVHTVAEKEMPTIDDAFVVELTGGNKKTVQELHDEIEKVLKDQKQQEEDKRIEQEIIDQLMKHNKIVFPESLIQDEARYIEQKFKEDLAQKNMDVEKYMELRGLTQEQLDDDVKKEATNRVSVRLNLRAIAEKHELQADAKEVAQMVEQQETPGHMTKKDLETYISYEMSLKLAYQFLREGSVK